MGGEKFGLLSLILTRWVEIYRDARLVTQMVLERDGGLVTQLVFDSDGSWVLTVPKMDI
jgi:hypothetical protein